ncbi:hypothetical protein LSUE1_G002254 [Lachnellula suecica]|uniref:Uncharacterized protein n=1 Tax=Lachnellula suecica TaxID=602035 RepID=A0A8T9CAP4_9HELO|nr:hypothetical protein LSUE1_G002254 [Lachnellula suecica]
MPPMLNEEAEYHGDTIVVKGEYGQWSHPSSPDPESSMSPELEPLVNHLLAQIHTPQHLESPGPLEEISPTDSRPEHSSAPPQSAIRKQRQRVNALTMEERLQLMPEKRPMPWRSGVEPGADNETGGESRRKQIRFGCLLATRGEVQVVPCNSCANGRGKFDICVALEGFFKGACASCQLSGRPNRCSIKVTDDAPSSPTNTTGGVPLNGTSQQPWSDGPKQKRRRTEKQKEKVPEWESARPQWEQEMSEIVQRPWATVNPPPTPQQQMMMNGANGVGSAAPNSGMDASNPNSIGWAAVNQSPSTSGPPGYRNGGDNGASYQNSSEQAKGEETVMDERRGSVALIDTLPKHKQRQVYGLVSGLQGGIEHLQRELDSLKRALGIDED